MLNVQVPSSEIRGSGTRASSSWISRLVAVRTIALRDVGLRPTQTLMIHPSELSRLAVTLGGVPILGCLQGSPADRAGVRYGDIMLSINGIPTPSWADFFQARRRCEGPMLVRLFRDGRELDITVEKLTTPLSPQAVLAELQIRDLLPRAAQTTRDVLEE